ncbi:MAG: carboxypeptidase-like regulatory domain-containing protein [Bacteroidales bacterium]|nr:carboxypeptidase-like regulatory domain-containing protein [Bacteroidales bacterium]
MRKSFFLFIIFLLILNSCFKDADRVNPLDPKSNRYKNEGGICGSVTCYYPPYIGISGVELNVIPGYQGTITDKDGFFHINKIDRGQYLLIASKDGYASDSTTIQVKTGQHASHHIKLDALPMLEQPELKSSHISRWYPRPYDIFYIEFSVKVNDPDGANDISCVTVNAEGPNFNDTLSFSPETNFYQKMINAKKIVQNNPGALIGRQVLFSAEDKAGNKNTSLPVQLAQIIHETPITISPAGLQTVNATPQLTWQSNDLVFLYSYRVEINRTDVPILTMAWCQENIAATDTTIVVSDSLEAGEYYWTVAIVDEFGNSSRSKEAPFKIE